MYFTLKMGFTKEISPNYCNIKAITYFKYGYIIIGSIYRPPNSPVSYHDYIINDLDFISSFNYELIIMGDLNNDCYDKHNQSYVCNAKIKTLEIMYHHLKQIINKPTRVTAESSTLIDLILGYINQLLIGWKRYPTVVTD